MNASRHAPTWTLQEAMAMRRVRKATDLRRRLEAIGIDISDSQLSRLINEPPARISMELLGGLMTVLACDVSDLIRRKPPGEDGCEPPPPPPRRPKTGGRRAVPNGGRTEPELPFADRMEEIDSRPMPPRVGALPLGERVKR